MMLWKNSNKRMSVCLTVVTCCLVIAATWAILAKPETALAKKPDNPGGGEGDEATRYDVTMIGDLTLVGAFNYDQPPDWGLSTETGIRVCPPRPKICVTTDFLNTGGVTLHGETCEHGDGVIPDGDGRPNWGELIVEGEAAAVTVKWDIGETDAITGKFRHYMLTTDVPVPVVKTQGSGTWPNGDGDDITIYTITIPGPTEAEPGMAWSLVQEKPGNLDATLISTQDTVITFTEYTGQ